MFDQKLETRNLETKTKQKTNGRNGKNVKKTKKKW